MIMTKHKAHLLKRAVMQIAREEGQLDALTDYVDMSVSKRTPEQISFILKFFLIIFWEKNFQNHLIKKPCFL